MTKCNVVFWIGPWNKIMILVEKSKSVQINNISTLISWLCKIQQRKPSEEGYVRRFSVNLK